MSAQSLAAIGRLEQMSLGIAKALLRDRYGEPWIETSHPVAVSSPDHRMPWGTARDNSADGRFNARLIGLLPSDYRKLLDLGCSGGRAVRSFIEQGYIACGVEGSDLSRRQLRGEWASIPEFLFTADIAEKFIIRARGEEPFRFGIVTLWEVIEHLREDQLAAMLDNVARHLLEGGLVIMSISPNHEVIEGIQLHQTVKPREWWLDFFEQTGWQNHEDLVEYFGSDVVRGGANAPNSFHVVLTRKGEKPVLRNHHQVR
jgi:SAM-dependent methyltransferase